LIGRSRPRALYLWAIVLSALAIVSAGVMSRPLRAAAAALDARAAFHAVVFQSEGTQTEHITSARTVGEFLKERGITAGPRDYVRPTADTPLTDGTFVQYSPAVPIRLITAYGERTVITTAEDVGALLEEQGIHLGNHDVVRPSLADPIVANGTVRIARVVQWTTSEKRRIAERTVRVIDFSLPPGAVKIVRRGAPGVAVTMVDYMQTNGRLHKRVLGTRMLRKPQTRIIAEGVGTAGAIAQFARRGLEKTSYIASGALEMIATAYTAGCVGCTGYTASGYRAGHGIVAVDPSVIPLGTRLYIPGYGFAIAGDTGGAIHGNRIDLGFDTLGDALQFGRRAVKVYTLH